MVIVGAVAVAAGVGVLLVVGGSGDDDGVRTVQPGAPGEPGRELDDDEAADIDAPDHNAADVSFVQRMIVHHEQALAMTSLVADRTERDDLPLLAERITVSQEDEIERLSMWLTDRDEATPDDGDHQGHAGMPGMATPEQLTELEQARGPAFEGLFLDLMIVHHQGALTMVADLYAAGGGLEPDADRFAREIEADQATEIGRLQELLEKLQEPNR
jgi:uncharacterized protein (DUF305 family)